MDPDGSSAGAKIAAAAAAPALDASVPEFLPGRRIGGEAAGPAPAAEADAPPPEPGAVPSLIFGGGGDFLSKYNTQRGGDAEAAKARLRKRGPPARGGAGAGGAVAPDRVNISLNSLLVHARSVDKILQVVETDIDLFNAVNLITALHRLASVVTAVRKGTLRRDSRFKRLIAGLSTTLRNANSGVLKPQDLSNVAWALTKLGLLSSVLFALLSDHTIRTIGAFEPVNLSMTLWAFARSGFLDERLFKAAAVEVKRQLPDFQPQQIANTTWAMAKSGFVDEELFLAAASLALEKLEDYQPMNYSMLLYSFALAKLPHPKLFEEVGQRCTVQALSSSLSAPHVVTNLALAFSEAGVENEAVFDAIARVASSQIHDFRTQQIATLVQAFARAQVQHESLFACVNQAVVGSLADFKQHELQDLLGAYKRLGVSTAQIAQAVREQDEEEPEGRLNYAVVAAIIVLAGFLAWCSTSGVTWWRPAG